MTLYATVVQCIRKYEGGIDCDDSHAYLLCNNKLLSLSLSLRSSTVIDPNMFSIIVKKNVGVRQISINKSILDFTILPKLAVDRYMLCHNFSVCEWTRVS